jgi:hypothetical protein
MGNKKINELVVRTPAITDLMLIGDPSTGYSYQTTLNAISTLIEANFSLNDLSDVVLTSPTNGQVLQYNGTNWVNASVASSVTSVFGRTGAVVATEGDYSLTQLSDVTLSAPTTNQVLQYNGTAWVNATISTGGITSLNGLTASTQTFATGTSGTDFNISSTTSTHTFNIPTASATNRGLLSSANWTTFNNKVNNAGSGSSNMLAVWTGTNTIGVSLIESSASSQQVVSYVDSNKGFFIDASIAIFGIHTDSLGLEVNLANGNIRIGDPAGLFGNSTALYINQSGNYISASYGGGDIGYKSDFAGKFHYLGDFDALFNGTTIIVNDNTQRVTFIANDFYVTNLPSQTTSNPLYYDTTTGQISYGTGGGGGGVSGSGTTNYIPKWTGTTTLGNSLIQDNGTQLGYGTSPNASFSHLFNSVGTVTNFNTGTNGRIKIQSSFSTNSDGAVLCPFSNFIFGQNIVYTQPNWTYEKSAYAVGIQMEAQVNGAMYFFTAPLGSAGGTLTFLTRMAIFNDGTITINKSVASTYRLDIQGVTDGLRVTGSGTTSATTGLRIETSGGTSNFVVLDNGNCGIRQASPSARLHIATGGATTASLGLKVRNSADSVDILSTFGTTQVIINSNSASLDASAQLQIDSTTRGVLLPRMTDTQITSIVAPANGLMVYSTTQNHIAYYDGGSGTWKKVNNSNL